MENYIVIHYGEIAIKGKNRHLFERALIENIRENLKGCSFDDVKKISGRFILKLNKKSELEEISSRLKKIFGISYFAFANSSKSNIDDIKKVTAETVADEKAKTVRVLTKRSNKQFPMDSVAINKEVGEYLINKFDFTVDLVNAELSVWIEIVEKYVFVYTKRIDGLGGLPVGVSGKVLALISGGIDSPVAAYLMMKRGCSVKFAHFFNDSINSRAALDKIKDLVKTLSQYNKNTKLYIVPFKDIQAEIIKYVPSEYRMIVYRRLMFAIAEMLAKRDEAKALVTGDNLAQVSSQTLDNMSVIRSSTEMLVLTPVLGFDKQEIVDFAKKIGTYETSIQPYEDCCSYYIAKHPATKSRIEDVQKIEKRLDIGKQVSEAIAKKEIVTF